MNKILTMNNFSKIYKIKTLFLKLTVTCINMINSTKMIYINKN